MAFGRSEVSAEELQESAGSFGYTYTALQSDSADRPAGRSSFEGMIGLQALPCGARVCISDLTGLCASEHAGELSRSLTIVHMLDGPPADCRLGPGYRLHVPAGCAAMVSIADAAMLTGRYEAGQRSRCVLVQTRPEDLLDDELAEKVDKIISATSVRPVITSHGTHKIARDLFEPRLGGSVGRLLLESCALELLARGLTVDPIEQRDRIQMLTGTDRSKMLVVRDMLKTNPEKSYRLCDIAREAGVSVAALKLKFPILTGKPVFEYLREVRLKRAYKGLQRDGWTVSQAAHFVGYGHQSNFSAAFTRKFGVRPSEVRRRGS